MEDKDRQQEMQEFINKLDRELLPFSRDLLRLFKENTTVISHAQLSILKQIAEKGPVHSRELAEQFQISCAGISQLISQLIARELIYKERSEEDGRVFNLSLTKSGEEVLQGNREVRRELLTRMSSILEPDEKQSFLTVVIKLRKNLRQLGG